MQICLQSVVRQAPVLLLSATCLAGVDSGHLIVRAKLCFAYVYCFQPFYLLAPILAGVNWDFGCIGLCTELHYGYDVCTI